MDRRDALRLLTVAPFAPAVLRKAMTLRELGRTVADFAPTPSMPVLFLGHGNPMNAIEDDPFTQGWQAVATDLPKPNAILCISAHWETRGTFVTATDKPRTIHDFGGFPQPLFDVQYPAPGSASLVKSTQGSRDPIPHSRRSLLGLGPWGLERHHTPLPQCRCAGRSTEP